MEEMKSMGNAFRRLESTRELTPSFEKRDAFVNGEFLSLFLVLNFINNSTQRLVYKFCRIYALYKFNFFPKSEYILIYTAKVLMQNDQMGLTKKFRI